MTRGLEPSEDVIEMRRKYDQWRTASHEVMLVSDSENEDFLLDAVNVDTDWLPQAGIWISYLKQINGFIESVINW